MKVAKLRASSRIGLTSVLEIESSLFVARLDGADDHDETTYDFNLPDTLLGMSFGRCSAGCDGVRAIKGR